MAEGRKKTHKTEETKKKAAPHRKKEVAKEEVIIKPAVHKLPKAPKISVPQYFGTGRRKEAVVKVRLIAGTGRVLVNNRPLSEYFCGRKVLELHAMRPFVTVKLEGKYDVSAAASGGGYSAQADALGLGIARALLQVSAELKPALKREHLLTRDSRMKERKKYGLKRARRAFQYTKR